MSGYRRYRVTEMGVGAAEIWAGVTDDVTATQPTVVGRVLQTFDRSAYLTIDREALDLDVVGPRLVLLGGSRFTGPLAMVLDESARGFRGATVSGDGVCRLRRTTTGGRDRYVLTVGTALEVEFDDGVVATPPDPPPLVEGGVPIEVGDPTWAAAVEAVQDLLNSGLEDGLGWLEALGAVAAGRDVDHELVSVAEAWVGAVSATGEPAVPDAVRTVLGRGPGATPSGDDITAGIVVTLLATTTGPTRRRVEALGDALVDVAGERTTTVSTALLAQATRGRVPAVVRTALSALLAPTERDDREAVLADLGDVGHSSGVDMAVGMVLAILCIVPAVTPSA